MTDFPTDDATLVMLIAACEINEDTGRTHLADFLDMGARIKSYRDITVQVFGEEGAESSIPVFDVEYEEGYEPFSPQHVIRTLAAELMETRAKLGGAA